MVGRLSIVLSVLVISACTANTHLAKREGKMPEDISDLLADEIFLDASYQNPLPEIDLFALPAEMQAYLDKEVMVLPTEERRYRAIREWAFNEADRYQYDPDTTVPIHELANAGKINCFSFSNLFVAAARYAGIDANVQLVYSPPNWDIDERTWILNQHINVTGVVKGNTTFGESRLDMGLPSHTGSIIKPEFLLDTFIKYVVDLNPKIVVNAYRTELLDDNEVASRYYSNVAAQLLLSEKYNEAYIYTKKAILEDMGSSVAWNNLGVLYSRSDQPDLAREAYLTAIQVDPDADAARNNLASLYKKIGDTEEATAVDLNITARRNQNPYYHYYLGKDLLTIGDYEESLDYFLAAIRRKKDEQLFYLAMAEAQLALNQLGDAERSLKKAEKYATKSNSERYAQLTRTLLEEKRTQDL